MVLPNYIHLMSRDACSESVEGFSGAIFQGFNTFDEAITFVAENTLKGTRKPAELPEEWKFWSPGNNPSSKTEGQRTGDARAYLGAPLATPLTKFSRTPPTLPNVAGKMTTSSDVYSNISLPPYVTPPTSPDLSRSTRHGNGGSSNMSFTKCSAEQREILSLVSKGQNVFFTGSAGTGKTFVVRKIRHVLENLGFTEYSDFFVTASTGIIPKRLADLGAAGYHIGGMTLHYFMGCGLAEDGVMNLQMRIAPRARKQLEECKVLVIDEISMVRKFIPDSTDGRFRLSSLTSSTI